MQYQAVAPYVIRKRIRFHQIDVYDLLFQVSNCLEPFDAPASFWSFDQANCKGGALREYFPALDFERTQESPLACSPIPVIAINGAGSFEGTRNL